MEENRIGGTMKPFRIPAATTIASKKIAVIIKGPGIGPGGLPTSKDVRPLTNDQDVQLRRDLALVEERLQDIAILMRVCYGEESQAAIRADETSGALQRLNWALERTKVQKHAAAEG